MSSLPCPCKYLNRIRNEASKAVKRDTVSRCKRRTESHHSVRLLSMEIHINIWRISDATLSAHVPNAHGIIMMLRQTQKERVCFFSQLNHFAFQSARARFKKKKNYLLHISVKHQNLEDFEKCQGSWVGGKTFPRILCHLARTGPYRVHGCAELLWRSCSYVH